MARHALTADLPSNQTPLENSVAALFSRILETPVPIRALANPDECPVEFLPHLAWSYSVDVWDPDWPEQLKRDVIKASPEVHRLKGTLHAVKVSLEALGIDAEIEEWWQAEPPKTRGTFTVSLNFNSDSSRFWLGTDFAMLRNAITSSKPLSRAYGIRAKIQESGALNVGVVATTIMKIRTEPAYAPAVAHDTRMGVGVSIFVKQRVETKP